MKENEKDNCPVCGRNDMWEYFLSKDPRYPNIRLCNNCGREEWKMGGEWHEAES